MTTGKNKLDTYTMDGKKAGSVELDAGLFDGKVNTSLLWEVVKMYEANMRQGTATAKSRGHVRGGGNRPYPQKGTGRARHSSIRSPIWRKGGVVFGPQRRDFSYAMPKKKRALALLSALNARFGEDNIKVLEELVLDSIKTKKVVEMMGKLGLKNTRTLIVDTETGQNLRLSVRNVSYAHAVRGNDLNAYSVVGYKAILFTKQALLDIQERLKKAVPSSGGTTEEKTESSSGKTVAKTGVKAGAKASAKKKKVSSKTKTDRSKK